jgi:hypothetical protein
MDFLNHPELIVVFSFGGTAIVAGLVYGGYKLFSKSDDLAGDMLNMHEKTKDIELPKDDPMILKGSAKVEGPDSTQLEADQGEVVIVGTPKPKETKKKASKKKKKVSRKSLPDKIMTYMNKREGEAVKASAILRYFRQFSDQSVYSALNKLKKQGKLQSAGRGFYKVRKR